MAKTAGSTAITSAGKKRKSTTSNVPSKTDVRKRKHADIVTDGKRIWNQLRQKKNVSPQQRRALMDELVPLVISTKTSEIALQHDGSRLVQAAIQFGTAEERESIVDLLVVNPQTIVDLCQSQYAHFLLLKIFKYCSKQSKLNVVAALQGHMAKLAVHATASRVVEAVWQLASQHNNSAVLYRLQQELYGPHCALFGPSSSSAEPKRRRPTLASNIAAFPDKKDIILTFVRSIVDKGVEKQLYGFSYFQSYLLEYLHYQSPAEIRLLASTAALADAALHLVSTKAGTHVVTLAASYATAKERKRMAKSLKGYAVSGLLHRDAYLAILRLVQVTDDTVSIYKNLLAEVVATTATMLQLALSSTASKLFLWLLLLTDNDDDNGESKQNNKLFDPYEQSLLFPHPVITENGVDNIPTSKKDNATRRRELLDNYVRQPLIGLCQQHAADLLVSIPGAAVVRAVYARYPQDVGPALVTAVVDSTLLLEHGVGHRAVKNLLGVDAAAKQTTDTDDDDNNNTLVFTTGFVETFGNNKKYAQVLESNRGAFVLRAACDVVPSILRAALTAKDLQDRIRAAEGSPTAGYEALLKFVEQTNEEEEEK